MKPALALAALFIVTGCGRAATSTSASHSVTATATAQPKPSVTIAKPSITLAKDNWTDRLVISNLNKSWSANIIRVAYESDWNKFTVTSTLPDAHQAAEVCRALKSMIEQDGTEEPAVTILGQHDRPLAVFRSGDTACATP